MHKLTIKLTHAYIIDKIRTNVTNSYWSVKLTRVRNSLTYEHALMRVQLLCYICW